MLYPKNNRYHSTYHEPLFFEPSKDIADARTQTYFNWYKGDRSHIRDKNFYPSRWPRITNNERNYSHDVFRFGNCAPLHENPSSSVNHIPQLKDTERFTAPKPDIFLRQEQKHRREIRDNHINSIKTSREERERERWNRIVRKDKMEAGRLEDRRLHTKTNKPSKGFNIINNQYMNDASGRELALVDSIEKQKVNYLSLKRYERMNTYDPIKGLDIKKHLVSTTSVREVTPNQLKPIKVTSNDSINSNSSSTSSSSLHRLHNENSAASVEPIYRLNVNNRTNANRQLEEMLLTSQSELQRRQERLSEFQKPPKRS